MESQAALETLARADAEAKLPRLGGMARPDGVVIVSERFWAFATLDGSVREGEMSPAPRPLRRIPLVRGLARLGSAISPLMGRRGVARARERWFLAIALLASFAFFLLALAARAARRSPALGVMLAWILRGRTLRLHGAEHRAIAAVEQRSDARDVVGRWRGPSRFAARCGTNFAALVLPVAAVFEWMWPLPAAIGALLSLGLTMELWTAVEGRTAPRSRGRSSCRGCCCSG